MAVTVGDGLAPASVSFGVALAVVGGAHDLHRVALGDECGPESVEPGRCRQRPA